MRVGVLGRVVVWDDRGEEVALRPQVRRLLGLLVATDSMVTIDQITEYVSGGRRTGSAARTAAGRLRSVVGDRLVTVGSGYELVLAPDELDVSTVEALRARAGGARSNERVELLATALESWRGSALGDLAEEAWAAPTVARLDRLRADTLEDLAEAQIEVGRWSDAVTLLEPHLADVPYQERPVALLMRALAGSGRVTDALRCLRSFRVMLRNDIGVGPSQSLMALELDLLREADPRPDDTADPWGDLAPAVSNIREPLSSFVGRVDEAKELVDDLTSKRLITLTGPGGTGKTRLAIRVAGKAADQFPDGVWFVDLATVSEATEVENVAATTLGVQVEPGTSPTESIIDHLRRRGALIILDNCEHLRASAASLVAALTHRCPSLRVLVTSRERLGVDGEAVHPVRGLDDFEAHALFCARAAQADDRFEPSDGDRLVIETICRRLDGLPLAIELAAARTRSLTPTDVLERLDDRFRVLNDPRTGAARHGSLSATVEWSYELLDDIERAVFDRLSVFPGDFDHAAAMAVGAVCDTPDNFQEVLDSLIDKSLLVADRSHRHARYRMLETLRAYGAARLIDRHEMGAARRRHQEHFVSVAQRIRTLNETTSFRDMTAFAAVRTDWHNFRTAVSWALDDDDPGRAAAIALLPQVFYLFLDEHADWVNAIIARLPAGHPLAGICLGFAALWNTLRGDNAEALRAGRRGLELEDPLGGVAHRMLWWAMSEAHLNTGDAVEGLAAARRSLAAGAGRQTDVELMSPLSLALVSALVAEPDAAEGFADRIAAAAVVAPSDVNASAAANAVGYMCLARGDIDEAIERFRHTYDVAVGIPHLQGVALRNLAVAASWSESPEACGVFADALDQFSRNRMRSLESGAVEGLAIFWARCGRLADAAVLIGYLERHGLAYGMLVEGRREVTAALETLPAAGARKAIGAAMRRDDLIAFALDRLGDSAVAGTAGSRSTSDC